MVEIFLVAFVAASSPLPPQPVKEVAVERLVGLPAKREDEVVLPVTKVKRRKNGQELSGDINSQGFGQLSFNRRGFRKTAGSKAGSREN